MFYSGNPNTKSPITKQDLWNWFIILRGGEWVQSQLCAKSLAANAKPNR